jgi:hypothetical protein
MTMTGTDVSLILLGAFLIVSRGSLAIWPVATRNVYLRLLKTSLRVRVFGLAILPLPLVIIVANQGEPRDAAVILTGLGYIFIFVVIVFLFIIPGIYRLVTEAVLDAMDTVMLRGVGAISTAIGILLIYAGVT